MMSALKSIAASAAAVLVAGLLSVIPTTATATTTEALQIEQLPFEVDQSNRAGWWHPVAEWGGETYFIFNAPASTDRRHEVHIARRDALGAWTAECLPRASGGCAEFLDDLGHNQPSIAIDGDGYIHAFVSMHYSAWQYYTSDAPGSISLVESAGDLPDQGLTYTYPVLDTAPNGDVYLLIRANPGTHFVGNLYHYELATGAWSRVATIADDDEHTPYPDTLQIDDQGNVHLLWEWAIGGAASERINGSYAVYRPSTGDFVDAGGDTLTLPLTATSNRYDERVGTVVSARLVLEDGDSSTLAGIAYRFKPEGSSQFRLEWAGHDGTDWQHEIIVDATFTTTATMAATDADGKTRVYFNRQTDICTDYDLIWRGGLHVAERDGSGPWQVTWLGGARGTATMAATIRDDGTDVLYLSSHLESPEDAPALYFATLGRDGAIVPATPGGGVPTSDNVLAGATVSASTTRDGFLRQCVADGNYWSESSRWLSAAGDPAPTLTLSIPTAKTIAEVRVYSGTRGESINTAFTVRARVNGVWTQVAHVTNSPVSPGVVVLSTPVVANAIQVIFPQGTARVYEVTAFETATSAPLVAFGATSTPAFIETSGGSSTTSFTLYNRGTTTLSGTLNLQAATGWTTAPATHSYALAAGAQQSVSYTTTSDPAFTYEVSEIGIVDSTYGTLLSVPVQNRHGILHASDGTPWYTDAGGWLASSLVGFADTTSRFAPGLSCATATWTPTIPTDGVYTVRIFLTANAESATQAVYTVTHAGGQAVRVVDQYAVSGQWYTLGAWEFDAGTSSGLSLSAFGSGFHRAASVQFAPGGTVSSPVPIPSIESGCEGVPEATPTPTPTPTPTASPMVTVTPTVACGPGGAELTVGVRNDAATTAQIRVTTGFGEEKFTDVLVGQSRTHLAATGQTVLDAGTVTVAGYRWNGGDPVYERRTVEHPGIDCTG